MELPPTEPEPSGSAGFEIRAGEGQSPPTRVDDVGEALSAQTNHGHWQPLEPSSSSSGSASAVDAPLADLPPAIVDFDEQTPAAASAEQDEPEAQPMGSSSSSVVVPETAVSAAAAAVEPTENGSTAPLPMAVPEQASHETGGQHAALVSALQQQLGCRVFSVSPVARGSDGSTLDLSPGVTGSVLSLVTGNGETMIADAATLQRFHTLQVLQQVQQVQLMALQIINSANVGASRSLSDSDPSSARSLYLSSAQSGLEATQLSSQGRILEAAQAVHKAQQLLQSAQTAEQEAVKVLERIKRGGSSRKPKRPRASSPPEPVQADPTSMVPELWTVPGGNPWTEVPEPPPGSGPVPKAARAVMVFRPPVAPRLPTSAQRFSFPVATTSVPRFATISPTFEHLPSAPPKVFPGAWQPDGSSRFAGVRKGPNGTDGKPTWWACVERLGVSRWLGPFRSESGAARAADIALLLTQGPQAPTNFLYDTEEFFADASIVDAEGKLAQLHADYFAHAYRIARSSQRDEVEAELATMQELEAFGLCEGERGAGAARDNVEHKFIPREALDPDDEEVEPGDSAQAVDGSSKRPKRKAAAAASSSSLSLTDAALQPSLSSRDLDTGIASFNAPPTSRRRFTSPYRGVEMWLNVPGKRWKASVEHQGREEFIGFFSTARAAAIAYDCRCIDWLPAGSIKLNFSAEERAALISQGFVKDVLGMDVYDRRLAEAATRCGWEVDDVLGGKLRDEAELASIERVPPAAAEAAARTKGSGVGDRGEDGDSRQPRKLTSTSLASPIGIRSSSVVRPVVEAAKKGDEMAASVIQAMSSSGSTEGSQAATVQALTAVTDGPERATVMKTVLRDVDPVALHLQMAADHQASTIAPLPSQQQEGSGIQDGHIVRM
jgi:hypothetical protein